MSNNSSTNSSSNRSSGGIGFCGLLTIVFIVLKLCGVIHWGWLWVLAPLWISIAIFLLVLIIILIIFLLIGIISG